MPPWGATDYIVSYRGLPLGIMRYGGKHYYSDDPPWVTPREIAEGTWSADRLRSIGVRKAPRKKLNLHEIARGLHAADESDFELLAIEAEAAWNGAHYVFPAGEWAGEEFQKKVRRLQ